AAKVLIGVWRQEHNTIRPHNALGYRPPRPPRRSCPRLSASLCSADRCDLCVACSLENGVNKLCRCAAAEPYQRQHEQQHDDDRSDPPLLVVAEEIPELPKKAGLRFLGERGTMGLVLRGFFFLT